MAKTAAELHLEAVSDYHKACEAEAVAKGELCRATANLKRAREKMEQARIRAVSEVNKGKLP